MSTRDRGGPGMQRTSPAGVRLAALCVTLTLASVLGAAPIAALAAPGDITTVAGTGSFTGGTSGGDGDGGPALQASISLPFGVATAPGKYYLSQNGSQF